MSLLREIQAAAIDSSVPLATLLRKCKVLAARLKNSELKHWIDRELNGYPSKEELPEYRVLRVNSKGHFSGPFQSGLRNADIPLTCLPEEARSMLGHSYFLSPVASLESLISSDKSGTFSEPWNPDIVAHVGDSIYEGMNCIQAWKVIPKNSVVAVLDTIRTRILNFVLEIEEVDPGAGEAPANAPPLPAERVLQIFHTNVSGNVHNLANASPGANQSVVLTEANKALLQELIAVLRKATQDEAVGAGIIQSAEAMASSDSTSSFRSAYLRFMSALSDHMQVYGTAVAPFLPQLSAMLV